MSILESSFAAQDDELGRLISAQCDGEIGEDDRNRLATMLQTDREAKLRYAEFLELHAWMLWRHREPAATAQKIPNLPESLPVGSSPSVPESHAESAATKVSPVLRILGRTTPFLSPSVLWSVAFVALATYGTFALIAWNLRPDKLPDVVGEKDASVAVVRDASDVQWSRADGSEPAESSIFLGEPLTISSGTIELELNGGAKLVIEGPADWSVDGKNSVSLRKGKLLARVPNNAIGFTVETPTAKIVDLGTEFGVVVDPRTGSSVHVIRGEVAVRSREAGSGPIARRLTANQAVQVGADSKLQSIAFDVTPFAAIQKTPRKSIGLMPNEIAGLRLWLSSDRGVEVDAAGLVERWVDQSGSGFDAVQSDPARRPVLLPSTDADRGSLRFDGIDDFLACQQGLDIDNAGDSTIFLQVTLVGPFKDNSGIFCLRPRQFADRDGPDGLLIAEDFHAQQRHIGIVQHRAAVKNAIVLAGKLFEPEPLVITFTKSQGTSTLRINGRTLDMDQFQFRQSEPKDFINTAGYVIGARVDQTSGTADYTLFCEMDLSVVLVYDRTIAGKESTAIETYLKTSHR
jgi:hypothetical protein